MKNASLQVGVYPNPANAIVTFSGETGAGPVIIYNNKGVEVAQKSVSAKKTFDVSFLPSGTYTLSIGNVAKKLLIVK